MSAGGEDPKLEQDQPSSRVAKRLLERRQTGGAPEPAESGDAPPVQKPIQAYIPEIHEQGADPKSKSAPPKENRKLLGRELLESIDDDIGDELAEAMAGLESRDFAAGPLPTDVLSPGSALGTVATGEKIRVRVVDVRGDDVFVDLGGKSEGVLSTLQFDAALPAPGESIEVIVDRYDDANGMYLVRRPGASQEADWNSVRKGGIIDVQVKSVNKGGLEVTSSGLRGFLPAGQADIGHLEDLSVLVGKTLRCEVVEANAASRNLVVSRKRVQQREKEELAQATRATLEVGQIRDGVVRKVLDFGAFVDIGGVDGLVPVSQMSWKRVRDAREVVREGDKVKVQVLNFEPDSGKLTLSLKQLFENPWNALVAQYPVGSIVNGRVTRAAEFGAFVELEPGIEGLIHISELSGRRVGRVTEVVKEGDAVDVKVLEVDPERQRIALSLKGAAAQAAEESAEEEVAVEEVPKPKKQPSKPLKGGLGRSGPLFG